MNNGSESFEEVQKKNKKKVYKDFIKAIVEFQPEQAVLIMGKHIPVEGKVKEYKYLMNITENIIPERIGNFINTVKAEAIRLETIKKQDLWKPPRGIIN